MRIHMVHLDRNVRSFIDIDLTCNIDTEKCLHNIISSTPQLLARNFSDILLLLQWDDEI